MELGSRGGGVFPPGGSACKFSLMSRDAAFALPGSPGRRSPPHPGACSASLPPSTDSPHRRLTTPRVGGVEVGVAPGQPIRRPAMHGRAGALPNLPLPARKTGAWRVLPPTGVKHLSDAGGGLLRCSRRSRRGAASRSLEAGLTCNSLSQAGAAGARRPTAPNCLHTKPKALLPPSGGGEGAGGSGARGCSERCSTRTKAARGKLQCGPPQPSGSAARSCLHFAMADPAAVPGFCEDGSLVSRSLELKFSLTEPVRPP